MGQDLPEILYFIARLLFIMLLLALVGKPLWFLLSKVFGSSMKLNLVQELVVDVCLGGFILYILALIPFGFFSYPALLAILIFCSSVSVYLIVADSKFTKYKKRRYFVSRSELLGQIFVLSLFLVALFIQCTPLTKFIFGSIHDTSLHALFAELIIENRMIPGTHDPYMPAAIIFPQGPHPIFAFATFMTGMVPPLSVFHVTGLFNAMTVLAAYHFGKQFIKDKWGGVSLAFMFTFVSTWPFFVTWGSNGFVLGFSYFFIAATFVKCTHGASDLDVTRRVMLLSTVGFFVGYLAAVHLSFFMVLGTLWLIDVIMRSRGLSEMLRQVRQVLFSLSMSIISILPFILRFIWYYPLLGHNIGLPTDIEGPYGVMIPIHLPLLTLPDLVGYLITIFSQFNASPHLLTRFIFIALSVVVVAFSITRALKGERLFCLEQFALTMIFAEILIIFSIILIPEINQFSEYSRFGFILFIPLMSLLAVFNLRIYKKLKIHASRVKSFLPKGRLRNVLLILLIFTPLYGPFIYYRAIVDTQFLVSNYNVYAATTQDDYDLMLWMRNNLSVDASILVNPFEPGLFIPSVSQKKIIYPFSAYQLSLSYNQLSYSLSSGILNSTTFAYLDRLNITHVYVGAGKSSVQVENLSNTKWDPNLFLGNPNFALTKRIGNAYLFKYNKTDPLAVLVDSFEYNKLSEGGWRVARSDETEDEGDCTISSSFVFDDFRSCRITFKSTREPSWISMFRKVYVSNPSNITVSFYLRQTDGFGPRDALMFIISDVSWEKQVCFNSEYVPLPFEQVLLRDRVGCYFEFNVSRLWRAIHDESLPRSFFIQILNYDTDRVENVAYVDAVSITYGKEDIFAHEVVIIRDSFEYVEPSIGDWVFYAPEEDVGRGNVTISNLFSYDGYRSLELKARKTSGSWYWCSAFKKFGLYNSYSNVTLSFYLEGSEGFGEKDAFMVIISDLSWRQQVYFSTNTEVRVPVPPVPLTNITDYFEFELSGIWENLYSDPLPETFYIQLMSYDSDGIENTAYVDEIVIRAGDIEH